MTNKKHIFIKAGEPLLSCNIYKKEKTKLDVQLKNLDNKFINDVITEKLIVFRKKKRK